MPETRHLVALSVRGTIDGATSASYSFIHPDVCERLPDGWACEFGTWPPMAGAVLPMELGVYAVEARDGEFEFTFVRDLGPEDWYG